MDLLEQPDIKKTYDKCKYIVKVWEHKFTKKHKRLPSKLDIREASTEVRHAYRKYFQLKSAALEQSFMDVEGFDDEEGSKNQDDTHSFLNEIDQNNSLTEKVSDTDKSFEQPNNVQIPEEIWGAHLNKKEEENKTDIKKNESTKPNLNLSITKKLFCGSKFSKRNPRKSLSFSHKNKSDANLDSAISLSQPAPNVHSFTQFKSEEAIFLSQGESMFKNEKLQIVTPIERISTQPINIIQSVLENNYRPSLKTVDAGWLKRVAEKSGTAINNPDLPLPQPQQLLSSNGNKLDVVSTSEVETSELTKVDYDSEDIIDDSDEDMFSTEVASFHIAKKRRVEEACNVVPERTNTLANTIQFNSDTHNSLSPLETAISSVCNTESEKALERNKSETDISNIQLPIECNEKLQSHEKADSVTLETNTKTLKGRKPPKRKPQRPGIKKKQSGTKKGEPKDEADSLSPRRSTRNSRVKVSLQEFSSEEEDAFHTDTDEKDPEFTLEQDQSKKRNYLFNDLVGEKSDEEIHSGISLDTPLKKTRKSKSGKSATSKGNNDSKRKVNNKANVENKEEESDEDKPYELEFSVKPRIVAPRYSNIKKVLKEKNIVTKGDKVAVKDTIMKQDKEVDLNVVKDKKQQAKDVLEKKIAAGKLNDNFVRINLKKKVFARGRSGKSFSKYKKAQWRSKRAKALCGPEMDMGGCDGGMLTCFNCGQIGHFAQNCKANKGDSLLPLTAEQEEECPYPTLEEASQMAKESVLSVRVPKLVLEKKQLENDRIGNTVEMDGDGVEADREEEEESAENDVEDAFDDSFDSEQLLIETLKLEEHVKKLDVRQYIDTVKVVKPYYVLKEDDTVIATPSEVYETLKKFGHDSFRPGQEQAIMRILSGKSTLVTLSTGSGKSLCYQLPAYLYSQREPCISLVISPLVSLMDDQVTGIPKFMRAACLHSNQTKVQRQKIIDAISLGELSVLLISPEAVVAGEKQTGFGSLLRKLPPIAFACIDEAHCVSQWSHNFRPSYLMICRVLRESLGVKTILGLTATATRATRDSIINHFHITDGQEGVISDIPLPDNLVLSVSKDPLRDQALLGLIMSERFKDCKSIIVYCTRRDECERIASFLRTSLKSEEVVQETTKKRKRVNLQAEPYHAGLSASRRRTIQNKFMSGELRIVVATVAFGMGINKSDIRAVIHFNMPNSFESYVQEVGRAGRDGLEAQCHVFLDSQGRDENELRRHIHANSIDHHVIRKLLQKIFIPCSCTGQCPKHEVAFSIEATVRALDVPEENISTLLCYLELHQNKYIELMSPAYTMCKVISYGGPMQIRKVSKECPPLAMALALHKSTAGEDPNVLEFPVVDVASAMGWESGICKHKLKNLEWTTVNNQPKRSAISVQFSNLGFRLLAPGNLTDDQLDDALDTLYSRVVDQEKKALLQLHAVHRSLLEVAQPLYRSCLTGTGDHLMKTKIRDYFNSPNPLESMSEIEPKKFSEEQLVSDIHALICMYRDNTFTGRSIARIFQGIQSPNYPAVIWGRCKFWRSHLDIDFHTIVKIATREIIKMR